MKLRMQARHLRHLKRWCASMLFMDLALGGAYFAARQEILDLMLALLG